MPNGIRRRSRRAILTAFRNRDSNRNERPEPRTKAPRSRAGFAGLPCITHEQIRVLQRLAGNTAVAAVLGDGSPGATLAAASEANSRAIARSVQQPHVPFEDMDRVGLPLLISPEHRDERAAGTGAAPILPRAAFGSASRPPPAAPGNPDKANGLQRQPSAGKDVTIQPVRSVATFQAQTPGTLGTPRRTVTAIDAALGTYIAAPGPQKLTQANLLLAAIGTYLGTPGRDQVRVGVVQTLQTEVQEEQALLTGLGAANGGLLDDLLQRAGGPVNIAALTAVAHQITSAYAAQLPNLITLTGGAAGLQHLQALVLQIQPANAFLLAGLIPVAGGAAHLGELTNLIQHATPPNAMLLFQLIPLAAGQLAQLDTLIQAAGVPHLGHLPQMIPDAGAHQAMPLITAAINHRYPGQGNLAADLTRRAAARPPALARFQQLVGMLPNFQRVPAPVAVPPAVQNEVNTYNTTAPMQLNFRIGQVEWAHFLSRHTMEYFDFGAISPVNDQWPLAGAAAAAQVEAVLATVLQTIYAAAAAPGWWLAPNVARSVPAGAFRARIGTVGGGPQLPRPAPAVGTAPSLILGQFFPEPAGGGGVIPMDRDDMNAVRQLL